MSSAGGGGGGDGGGGGGGGGGVFLHLKIGTFERLVVVGCGRKSGQVLKRSENRRVWAVVDLCCRRVTFEHSIQAVWGCL